MVLPSFEAEAKYCCNCSCALMAMLRSRLSWRMKSTPTLANLIAVVFVPGAGVPVDTVMGTVLVDAALTLGEAAETMAESVTSRGKILTLILDPWEPAS